MFFILPVGVDYRAQRYPVVTFTLMGINTLIYLIGLFYCWGDDARQEWWMETFWLIPEQSTWFTYLTTMFVHGGLFHLLGNMAYLFLFGSCVEDLIGRWRYLTFYLVGGLAAVFAHIAVTPGHFGSEMPLGGASGAISACMGGFVLLLHRSKIEFKWVFFFFLKVFNGEFFLPAWLVLSFWFGEDLLWMGLEFAGGGTAGGTAFGAHVGGFLTGMVMVAALKPILRREAAAADEDESTPTQSGDESPVDAPPEPPSIYLLEGGNQLGPFTRAHVVQMIEIGSVSGEALFWQDGMPEWRSVGELK